MRSIAKCLFFIALFSLVFSSTLFSQDKRAQYPGLLRKAYFGVNLGYIDYPFTNEHLAAGYTAQSVMVPHLAVRLTLLGYDFNKYLSARITYMRPINWVEYNNINADKGKHSVWM